MHCRYVISIDATHLRGKYNGKLFIAIGMDANEGIFSLAFEYSDEESHDTWNFFSYAALALHREGTGRCRLAF